MWVFAGVKKKTMCKGQTTERTQQEGTSLPELWRDNKKEPRLQLQRLEHISDGKMEQLPSPYIVTITIVLPSVASAVSSRPTNVNETAEAGGSDVTFCLYERD